jgi:hypothetical protein
VADGAAVVVVAVVVVAVVVVEAVVPGAASREVFGAASPGEHPASSARPSRALGRRRRMGHTVVPGVELRKSLGDQLRR